MQIQGKISVDPAANVTIKTGGRYEGDRSVIEIPSDQEVRDILGAADVMGRKNDFMETAWARYRPMIYLMPFTGLRMSENFGLPWRHLNSKFVDVKQRADKRGVIGRVKSKAARRQIELAQKVSDILFEWKDRCRVTTAGLVFPTETGRPVSLSNFATDAWTPLFKEADLMVLSTIRGVTKLRPKYTRHALRHFYASKLTEKGKDLKFIQNRLGHADIETTLNTYGHLMKDRSEQHFLTAEELATDLL